MQAKKARNFLGLNRKIFVDSAKKIDLSIILIIILDAVFYFLAGFLAAEWLQRVQAKLAAFSIPADIISLGPERAQQLAGEAKTFYYLIILSFVLLLIAIIFLASIIKGAIWAKTTDAKITLRLISKFFVLNLIWMGFWIMAVLLISLLAEPRSAVAFMAASLVIALYLTSILYTIYIREQKLRAIISAVKLGIAKIHLFLLPYAAVLLVFYIIIRLSSVASFRFSQILFGLIMISCIAFARYYLSAAVLEIDGSK